jgi:hypothetical protein
VKKNKFIKYLILWISIVILSIKPILLYCQEKEEKERYYLEIPSITIYGEDKSYIKLKFEEKDKILPVPKISWEELEKLKTSGFYQLKPEHTSSELSLFQPIISSEKQEKGLSIIEIFFGNNSSLRYELLKGFTQKLKEHNFEYILSVQRDRQNGSLYNDINGFNRRSKDKLSFNLNISGKNWLVYNLLEHRQSEIFFPYQQKTQNITYNKVDTEFNLYLNSDKVFLVNPTFIFMNYYNLINLDLKYIKNNKFICMDSYLGKINTLDFNLFRFYAGLDKFKFKKFVITSQLGLDSSDGNKIGLHFIGECLYQLYPKNTTDGFIKLILNKKTEYKDIGLEYFKKDHLSQSSKQFISAISKIFSVELLLNLPITEVLKSRFSLTYKKIKDFINIEPDDSKNLCLKNVDDVSISTHEIELLYLLSKYLKQRILLGIITCDKKIANLPYYKFGLNIEYDRKKFNFKLNSEYYNKRYAKTEEVTAERLEDFVLVNALLEKAITDNFWIYLLGENLLNQKYQLYKDYPAEKLKIEIGLRLKL